MSAKKRNGQVQHDFMTSNGFNSSTHDEFTDFGEFSTPMENNPPQISQQQKDVILEDVTDYVTDPIEKRKLHTINIIGELLQEYCYFRKDDNVIKNSTFRAIKHIASEFSDIDWQNVCISSSNGSVRSLQELIVYTNSLDILKFFVESNSIKIRTKDATDRLIVNIAKTTPGVINPVIQYISDKIMEEQEKEIETLKSITRDA